LCCAKCKACPTQATAANLCNDVPPDCFGLVEEAFPNLAELVSARLPALMAKPTA
jgi:hypothetical protein